MKFELEPFNRNVSNDQLIAELRRVATMLGSLTVATSRRAPASDGRSPRARSTPRTPGERLRFLVFRRDNFSCQICGRSPALHLGLVLHVDHVIPWSKGGETAIENLQTLCEPCNQ